MMKLLVAFDFDHTIISFNSDIIVKGLLPESAETEELNKKKNGLWLEYMQEMFNILHRINVTKEEILKTCRDIDATDGMIDLIEALKAKLDARIIIISDSNTVFIEHWLENKGMLRLIDRIYTNPGKFNADGLLEVSMYHEQDWCSMSTKNLCKAFVLEKHLEEEKENGNAFDVVAYVGDGRNDLCPLLKLKEGDYCFPRERFALDKILNENKEVRSQIKASIHPWKRGNDILQVLEGARQSGES